MQTEIKRKPAFTIRPIDRVVLLELVDGLITAVFAVPARPALAKLVAGDI